jgi:hypothetical protein
MIELIAAAGLFLQQSQGAACVPVPARGHGGASALSWYINNEPVTVNGSSYVKYGLPRVLGFGEVELVGSSGGGFFYAETNSDSREVLYLLTNLSGCEFQPYEIQAAPKPRNGGRNPTKG